MTQGRMVDSEMWQDARLGKMSIEAELFFMMALPHLDRQNLISGHPSWLMVHVIPLLTDMHEQIPAMLDEWIASGLVTRRNDGMLHFTKTDWHWHPDEEDEAE